MGNGTDGATVCGVCGSSVALDATTCATCGAQVGATVPTGARPPEDATNLLRVRAPASASAPTVATSTEADPARPAPAGTGAVWPGLTPAGLPTRVPRQDLDDDSLRRRSPARGRPRRTRLRSRGRRSRRRT